MPCTYYETVVEVAEREKLYKEKRAKKLAKARKMKRELNFTTELLCAIAKEQPDVMESNPTFQKWYNEHVERDEERLERPKKRKK
jgi:hypothetical protein